MSDTSLIKYYLRLYEIFPEGGIPYLPWRNTCNAVTHGLALGVGSSSLPKHLKYGHYWGWNTPIDFSAYLNQGAMQFPFSVGIERRF